jgi:hypothetical protein
LFVFAGVNKLMPDGFAANVALTSSSLQRVGLAGTSFTPECLPGSTSLRRLVRLAGELERSLRLHHYASLHLADNAAFLTSFGLDVASVSKLAVTALAVLELSGGCGTPAAL